MFSDEHDEDFHLIHVFAGKSLKNTNVDPVYILVDSKVIDYLNEYDKRMWWVIIGAISNELDEASAG